jgi:hypothetical protein
MSTGGGSPVRLEARITMERVGQMQRRCIRQPGRAEYAILLTSYFTRIDFWPQLEARKVLTFGTQTYGNC